MKSALIAGSIQVALLLLLLVRDRNDGGRELFRKQHWGNSDVVTVVLSLILLRFAWELAGQAHIFGSHPEERIGRYTPHLLMLVVVLIIFRLKIKQPIKDLGFPYGKFLKIFFLCALPVFFLVRLFVCVKFHGYFFIWMEYILNSLVVAPVAEEIAFRGILYTPFRRKYGPAGAILITALFFMVCHEETTLRGNFGLFLYGVLFAWSYERKQSMLYPIILHSLVGIPYLFRGR